MLPSDPLSMTRVIEDAGHRPDRSIASPAVSVRGLSKTFRVPRHRYTTLKERLVHGMRRTRSDQLTALHKVSFDVAEGEFFGVVGRNGSGKSTLLKCLAGIYDAPRGTVDVRGRISPFIELGVGLNPELSARDNVLISGTLLGLSRQEIRSRFDDVIGFAELEEFVDLALKNYSSGMALRLAFALSIQIPSDVLLIDEVLAVGDASFQQKCFDEFARVKQEGRTVVLVTHDMRAVELYCDRALLVELGEVVMIDEPQVVARGYNEINFGGDVALAATSKGERFGDQEGATIESAWFENAAGEEVSTMAVGDRCVACFEMAVTAALEHPVLGVLVYNEQTLPILATNTMIKGIDTGSYTRGARAVVRVAFEGWLSPGRYWLACGISREGPGAAFIDYRIRVTSLIVHGTMVEPSVVQLPHSLEISSGGRGAG